MIDQRPPQQGHIDLAEGILALSSSLLLPFHVCFKECRHFTTRAILIFIAALVKSVDIIVLFTQAALHRPISSLCLNDASPLQSPKVPFEAAPFPSKYKDWWWESSTHRSKPHGCRAVEQPSVCSSILTIPPASSASLWYGPRPDTCSHCVHFAHYWDVKFSGLNTWHGESLTTAYCHRHFNVMIRLNSSPHFLTMASQMKDHHAVIPIWYGLQLN